MPNQITNPVVHDIVEKIRDAAEAMIAAYPLPMPPLILSASIKLQQAGQEVQQEFLQNGYPPAYMQGTSGGTAEPA